ncbi:Transcription factor STKL2 [Arabidopsis thaliana]
MAPLESPATASSSEVESSSEEIFKSSSEESKPKDPVTVPSSKTLKSPSAAVNSKTDSSDDSEKQSFVLTRRKKKEGAAESPAVKSGKKRAGEGSTDMHVKRVKKEDDNKKPNPQRVWSEEDEISLLQAVIDFKAETGTSPWDHKNAFFDIAKKSISFDVSNVQFFDKIRSFKRKYLCLGLAVLIWGSDGMNVESRVKKDESILIKGKANSKEKKVEKPLVIEDEQVVILGADSEWFEESFFVPVIASLGLDEYSVKKKWSKVSVETKKRIQEKMKLVDAKKCELLLAEMDVLKEVTSVLAQTN